MNIKILILRTIHGLFALYFISCIFYIYFAVITREFGLLGLIAMLSLVLEGISVFILNHGDCPLIHLQRKIGDEKPFFELFLPKKVAKKAVPFFLFLTFIGLLFLSLRFLLN